MKRGEVRWYTFQTPNKRRPVLILTRDTAIGFLNAVTVAPITTTIRDIPSEMYLDQEDGLLEPCAANFDNILTIPKTQVSDLIATVSFEKMLEAEKAVRFALGFVGLV
jgi:mRNA interferase MazF